MPIQKHHSKKKSSVSQEAVMNMKRKRLWIAIGKKEIGRAQKQMLSAHKETLTVAKKLALACQREVRKSTLVSQKLVKDIPTRARRLTKEMMLYWKRYEKVEKEHRKRAEKEAQEQLRLDIELREAKRQQRKLNFLITQTELYAHFMSRKVTGLCDVQEEQILCQLDETKNDPDAPTLQLLKDDDSYNPEEMKALALKNAEAAFKTHVSKTTEFDSLLPPNIKKEPFTMQTEFDENFKLTNPSIEVDEEHPQPDMFVGKLKSYQLKGMNWLYSLYDKGINGILADEMGLGKTVQTIAFLATLIKAQGIWGPFLVIAPASTLHNWQQEFAKFVPQLKVIPYWGTTADRKVLRKFWNLTDLHTENASFHVLITSYQLVVQDVKYFQRIKWQYMILDEAQAIKSTSSQRWKILLSFNCRNRLLLTGTPIQNSMAELWALLHFIMPTLFDSHDEFNEWFSKDIESHAENKTVIDEKHLSRLHKILQPFMLRRVKKDVENELSDKIEILVYCPLTRRQKLLYQNLKDKISIDDLMQSSSTLSSHSQTATSSLMNLVMQFRKVCNHPDLFEKREAKSPLFCKSLLYILPKLLYREGLLYLNNFKKQHICNKLFGIFHPDHIHYSLFPAYADEKFNLNDCCFSFMRFIGLSTSELSQIFLCGLLSRWIAICLMWKSAYRILQNSTWKTASSSKYLDQSDLVLFPLFPEYSLQNSNSAFTPVFTSYVNNAYGFTDHHIYPLKTVYRKKSAISSELVSINQENMGDIENAVISPCIRQCQLTSPPSFLINLSTKVICEPLTVYSSDRSADWWLTRTKNCGSVQALRTVLYGSLEMTPIKLKQAVFHPQPLGGINALRPINGWSKIVIPEKETIVTDSGKLQVLDDLLSRLKAGGHRVLIYSQMTRMIDLLEDYMSFRKHTFIRLDGSSKIADRRDMVADFQSRSDIFVFLLSTRAGGVGINLTAADTVIFYDSDWNPTVDQQAMDRAHRLGQTKQVTVYRLICQGSIEERILQRAREKSEIQRMVISGGTFKPDTLKPKEVVSLLLDDAELEKKFRSRQEERKQFEKLSQDRKKRPESFGESKRGRKKKKDDSIRSVTPMPYQDGDSLQSVDSIPPSPYSEHSVSNFPVTHDDTSSEGPLVVDDSSPSSMPASFSLHSFGNSCFDENAASFLKKRGGSRGRGRPRGSGRGRGNGRGRGGVLSAAAAELAGAQAEKSAASAAYGFSSTASSKSTEKSPAFRSRGSSRGAAGSQTNRYSTPRGRGSFNKGLPPTLPTQSISLGFYMPGPQLQGP
ncbi:chromatin-remodeling ATPase INO80 [Caerostris darwini]|uniref:Chromatin-remodeling ATPase INO80 n=1 Tax=Caerostris darwini TaxID=1538125 RepID=A0AAV4UVV0_9ARAC|nr:chromatin-remodeling ATPase INO80 [Caerostris darwini]